MGWFDEQIRRRVEGDGEDFEAAFARMANIVMSDDDMAMEGELTASDDAVKQILAYYHIRMSDVPDEVSEPLDRLECLLRPGGVMWRQVRLEKGWSRNAVGPLLVENAEGGVNAAIPRSVSGYWLVDGRRRRVTSAIERKLGDRALCFYRPLPNRKLRVRDLLRFIFENLSRGDALRMLVVTLFITLAGMIGPYANKILFDVVVPSSSIQLIVPIAALLIGVSVSGLLFVIFRAFALSRIFDKLRASVVAATLMRMLDLPLSFFKHHSAGELYARMERVGTACLLLMSMMFTTGLTALFSLIYVVQIFSFTPALAVPALLVIVASAAYSVISVFAMVPWQKKTLEASARNDGLTYALVSGVQKLKLTGSERRAFTLWAKSYSEAAALEYRPPWFVRADSCIYSGLVLVGAIVLYFFAAQTGVSVADYMAFTVSYGLVSGAFGALAAILRNIAKIQPSLKMAAPILSAVPEMSESKRPIGRLMGGIEMNNISFRYDENSPYILKDLTLKIHSGQYVAVVGKTGCGKSTFIRMLLGFETPERGGVFYDGQDISNVDMKSLRQKIGTVTQSGRLFEGTIFSNIGVCAPKLTVEEAWEALEMAGLAEDVRAMPLGMDTFVSSGSGGLSGGQRQRLMIARAIAPKPRVLIFDEATSALDNITQKKVSEALDALKCTRIVVAHRLSTIRQCDRIVALDGGRIVEDGTFDELIAKDGFFAELVRRQMS